MFPITTPFKIFTGLDGKPLSNGKVYIGQVATDPTVPANQVPVFWDSDLTIPAAQPLTTNAGYIVHNGTPSNVFTAETYSITVKNASNIQVFYAADSADFDYGAILAKPTGASLIGFISNYIGGVYRTVMDKLRDHVSVKDFGAKGDGITDDTAAVQAATNSGRAVYFPGGTYRVAGVSYTGRVNWYSKGDATIMSDVEVLAVTNGSYSKIKDIRFVNITAPWIIRRNKLTWALEFGPAQSNEEGYQPTVSDLDIWSTLTPAQQGQDIGPKLTFAGNASGIEVSGLTGEFLSILIYDAQYSSVHDCNFRAGKNFAGGIVFWNINGQIGYSNSAVDNVIRYPSFCGVTAARNYDGVMSRNRVDGGGESGIKTYQNETGGVDARCYRMQVQDNNVTFMFYDSLDLASDFPLTGTKDSRHTVTGNNCFGSRQTGLHIDGLLCMISGNNLRGHFQDGIKAFVNNSMIAGNMVSDNNRRLTAAGVHHITIEGGGNSISGNRIRTAGAPGAPIYAIGNNYASSNLSPDGAFFWGNVGSITASLVGNADMLETMQNTVPQRFRQNSTTVPAFELYSESNTIPDVDFDFHPRHEQLRNPIARIKGYVSVGNDNAEYGGMILYGASDGALYRGFYLGSNPGIPGKVFPVLNVSNVAVTPAMLDTSSLSFWVDEAGNALKLSVKYSNGTTKTASIALT